MRDAATADLLGQIESLLSGALELPCGLLDSRSASSSEALAVALESDGRGRPRVANLSFLPVGDDEEQEVRLLQFHCMLPVAVSADCRTDLERFLTRTNALVPIGAFSITGDDELIFKYVHAIGRVRSLEERAFVELFLLWMFTLDSLSGVVEDVASGARTADAALAELG